MIKQKNGTRRWNHKLLVSIGIACVTALFVLILLMKITLVCGCYNPIYDMTSTAFASNHETATEELFMTGTALP